MDPGAGHLSHDHAQAAHGGQAAVQAALHSLHEAGQQLWKHRRAWAELGGGGNGAPGGGSGDGAPTACSPSWLSRSSASPRCARQMRMALLT